jgi:hypothetical protein
MCVCLSIYICAFTPLTSVAMGNDVNKSYINKANTKKANIKKTDLHEKYYQQALYYYFQGNYSGAFNIISQGRVRLGALDQTSQLFEAGLQIKLGLQEEARQNLLLLGRRLQEEKDQLLNKPAINNSDLSDSDLKRKVTNKKYKANSEQLLVVALLSLSEQFIEQGHFVQAQDTLAKIARITPRYYQQYHVLSQLAYWPEKPDLLIPYIENRADNNTNENVSNHLNNKQHEQSSINNQVNLQNGDIDNNDANVHETVKSTPYIQLNNALRFIDKGEFKQAVILLDLIKNRQWEVQTPSFFQSLFTEDTPISLESTAEAQLHNQAINDYARLLLANVYVQQEAYDEAYVELENFPQESPYSESALFLFAFSAQQIQQHTTALSLLTLLHEQYPYSTLGWQASLLMAQQVTEQKGLTQGWKAYQDVEMFFLNTLDDLNIFEQSFANNDDLLSLSTTVSSAEKKAIDKSKNNRFIAAYRAQLESKIKSNTLTSTSPWLKQAKYDVTLSHLYQQLSEVNELHQRGQTLQNKSDWIVNIIALNTKRKSRISTSQKEMNQQKTLENYSHKRDRLSALLVSALNDSQQKGTAFANEKEQAWLERINQSKQNLSYIVAHSEERDSINNQSYQARLARLDAVLMWQLNQAFPDRAWQHKQQLITLDNSLNTVENLQTNVSHLLAESSKKGSNSSLSQFISRQVIADKKIMPVMDNLATLKGELTSYIHTQISQYVDERRTLLTQHLLTTRKAMAAVLEKMSDIDQKREQQLQLNKENTLEKMPAANNPTEQTIKDVSMDKIDISESAQ